jgi:hypothetical protein
MDGFRNRLGGHPFRSVTIAVFTVVALLAIGTAVGASISNHDTELLANKGAKRLLFQTNADANTFTSSGLQVTGSGTITVPAPQTGFFVATFTSESNCAGSPGGYCSIVINCDGVELQPAVGTDFAFDSVGPTSSTSNWHSLSVTRRSNPVTGGNHSCEVRESLLSASSFRLDDWIFEVEFWRQ